ncbi:efflux RND transporter periplasmic adaptor subunit [Hymenobacter sp. ISL-91]|uniref:efflux RND transporter periplasmic adaptor subunit n=1 Tax=Hymenobacter sp. ISL-91 TaxID=2819151 RepID=UPI001BEA6303|nr:biotin/lipoyl-binding protein [Hymenobacter sp. ISL-91]MBT2557044.1 efflux RND transporter periplasmic adaptor subunit [Hymenobacter sp. ISL-91]
MKKSISAGLLLLAFAAGGTVVPRWLAHPRPAPVSAAVVPQTPTPAAPAAGEPLLAGQSGRVHEVFYHVGQQVRRGQLLLKLLQKQPSVQQQQLQLRLQRQQQAYVALQRQAAPAGQLQAAQAQLAATREQLARAVPMFNFVYVTAPADGQVLAPTAHAGDQLRPDSPVAQLVSLPAPDTTPLLSHVE